jgi:hypothetical protein
MGERSYYGFHGLLESSKIWAESRQVIDSFRLISCGLIRFSKGKYWRRADQ